MMPNVEERLLPFSSESTVLPPAVRKIKVKIRRTINLPVVLYGCETWSLSLREVHRLRVLRRLFGPKRDEVMGQ
jgi:hypothetical protein